jgi:hypothetical protein
VFISIFSIFSLTIPSSLSGKFKLAIFVNLKSKINNSSLLSHQHQNRFMERHLIFEAYAQKMDPMNYLAVKLLIVIAQVYRDA